MLNTLDPQYELTGRKYFSDCYPCAVCLHLCEKANPDLHNVTTDLWSSSTGEPYTNYTVHFVDSGWCLQSQCLQVLYVPQDHTADNLADAMVDTFDTWGSDAAKQVCLTTDNGRNIVCATSHHLQWNHLPCFGHIGIWLWRTQ